MIRVVRADHAEAHCMKATNSFLGEKGAVVCCTTQLWQLYCATLAPDSPVPSAGKGRYYRLLHGRTAHGRMNGAPSDLAASRRLPPAFGARNRPLIASWPLSSRPLPPSLLSPPTILHSPNPTAAEGRSRAARAEL